MESENINGGSTYPAGTLEYSGVNANSVFDMDDLWYSFKPTKKSFVIVGVNGVPSDNFAPTTAWEGGSFFSDYFDSPAFYEQDADEVGIGGNYQFNDNINLAAGFLSDSSLSGNADADSPAHGVFNSNWAGMTQLTGTVGKFEGALAFVHEYKDGTRTATGNFRFFDNVGTPVTSLNGDSVTAETVGVSMKYEFSPRFILSAFGTHSWGNTHSGPDTDAQAYSAGIGFVLPDLFREGNTGGIAVGIPPTVYSVNDNEPTSYATPIAVDLFYDFKVSDNITITPGGIVLFNGNDRTTSDTVLVGAIKTKFKF